MKRSAVYVHRLAGVLAVVVCAPAMADISFAFNVSNIITVDQPSATVELWAYFNEDQYAFAGALFDVHAGADAGGFSDPFAVLNSYGTSDGAVDPDGDAVSKVIAGQLHFPLGDYYADTSNPILVWTATWSTDDFTQRKVSLATDASKYFLYLDDSGLSEDFHGQGYKETTGVITVVPAPGSVVGVAAIALAAARRRRGT